MNEPGGFEQQQSFNPDTGRDLDKVAAMHEKAGGVLLKEPEEVQDNADGASGTNESDSSQPLQPEAGETLKQDSGEPLEPGLEEPKEEKSNIPDTPEEKLDVIETSIDNLIEIDSTITSAKNEEDFKEASSSEAKSRKMKEVLDTARDKARSEAKASGITDEAEIERLAEVAAQGAMEEAEAAGAQAAADAEEEAKTWLDRAGEIAGITFGEFQKAHEGSDMKTFLDLFFVFGVEGKYGSGLATRDKENETPGDTELRKRLEGSPVNFIEAMSKSVYRYMKEEGGVLEKDLRDFLNLKEEDAAEDPQLIYKAVKYFNYLAQTEKGWDHLQTGLAEFCGSNDYTFGLETKKLFTSLESISAIKQFLNIDSAEASEESDNADSSDQDGDDTNTTS